MEAGEYKKVTASPDVFSGAALEATVRCLRAIGSPFADEVAMVKRTPIPNPPLHHGGYDFFRLGLPLGFVSELIGELLSAEADAVSPEGATTPQASHRADLVDLWGNYQRWLK